MFQFIGYSAFSGPTALDNAPSQVNNITSTQLTNAIFDHFNLTTDTELKFDTAIPNEWNFDTIMDANFNGDINAGNIDFLIEQISAIKIKRRISGTFDWLLLETIPINSIEDLSFVFVDRLNAYGLQYDYALVPVIESNEGDYLINTILSKFNGVFIGDYYTTFRFLYDVQYGTNARNQQTGVFTPLGRQYPIIVSNGILSYESGSVSGMVLNDGYSESGEIDPTAIVQKKTILKDFLTNKKAKILKDLIKVGQLYSNIKL